MSVRELNHMLGYVPHAGQHDFHESDARFKVLIAGARFGKSFAAARDMLPDVLAGNTRGWLAAPLYPLTGPEYRTLRSDLRGRLRAGPASQASGLGLACAWGSAIECHSTRLPESLLAEEIDWLILCEAAHMDRDTWERYLRARLATRLGRVVVPTTPRGRNWVHELYERGQLGRPDWASFKFATWHNPKIAAAEIDDARATLPADTFDEQYGGEFSASAGRVYREFTRELHVAHAVPINAGAVVFKAIDFGYTNPFACLWGTLDADGRLLIVREYHASGRGLAEHASAILAVDNELQALGAMIGPGWSDPSGALEREQLAIEGVRTMAANNKVSGGIEAVRGRLLARADGTPGLLIDARCTNLLREIEAYEWEEGTSGRSIPVKINDHALDALRYLCVALDRRVSWQPRGKGDG